MKTFKITLVNQFNGESSIHFLTSENFNNLVKNMFEQNRIANSFVQKCMEQDNIPYKWNFAN